MIVENPQDHDVDFRVKSALARLQADGFGRFSIRAKDKVVIKYGRSPQLTADTATRVATVGNKVDLADNLITHVVTNDTGGASSTVVTIEGHTQAGTGTAGRLTFVRQEVTLTGATPVALATPLRSATRIANEGSVDLTGDVYVMVGNDVDGAGDPSDAADVQCQIRATENQTEHGQLSVSDADAFIVTGIRIGMLRQQAVVGDFRIQVRQMGGVWRTRYLAPASRESGLIPVNLDPVLTVPPNADLRAMVAASASNAFAVANIAGYLARRDVE